MRQREDNVLSLLEERGALGLHEVSNSLDVADAYAYRTLLGLVSIGAVEVSGSESGQKYQIYPAELKDRKTVYLDTSGFGICGDLHIGDKMCDEGSLRKYVGKLVSGGISHVFVAGDIFAGVGVYDEQEKDLRTDCKTIDGQIKRLNKIIPKQKDLEFIIIAGNHDLYRNNGWFQDSARKVCETRKDFFYGGTLYSNAIVDGEVLLNLSHPIRDESYLKSLRKLRKKYEEPVFGEDNESYPKLIAKGHSHYSSISAPEEYSGMRLCEAGTFQRVKKGKIGKRYIPRIGGHAFYEMDSCKGNNAKGDVWGYLPRFIE